MGCDDPTHDDHKGVDPVAHRWQADMPKVSDFNLNASDRGKEKVKQGLRLQSECQ